VNYLSLEDILRLHYMLVEDFGGMHGVRDEGRLKSVVEAPQAVIYSTEQYATVYEKAAVYMRTIIQDHPFHDGNKRSGITVGGVFLQRNGARFTAKPIELENFAVRIATDRLDVDAIAAWLQAHATI